MEDNRCGKLLRTLRRERDLSIEKVAVSTHIALDTLWRYEQGKQLPTFKNEEILCEFFGISLNELHGIGDNDSDKKKLLKYDGTF